MADVAVPCKPLIASGIVQDPNGTTIPGNRYFRVAVLNPAGTACRVVIYDNNTNSGTILADVTAAANDKSVQSPDFRIPFSKGLYAQITGGPTSVMVYVE